MADSGPWDSHWKGSICPGSLLGRPKRSPGVRHEPPGRGGRHIAVVVRRPRLGFLLMAELFFWPEIFTTLLDKRALSVSKSTWAMHKIMRGEATPSQLGGFLVALRAKGETVD